jgi:aldose 1-epimerase
MLRQRVASLYHTMWRKHLMRSGMLTVLLLGSVLAGLTVAYRAHMQGNFHRLKAKMATERPESQVPRPGGQDVISLARLRTMSDATPEFLSATLLPGRGMNVLQITAYVPGKGEVNLLASPSIEGANSTMTGTDADADGEASLGMGAAFEAPWAGEIWGVRASDEDHLNAMWRGHGLTLPDDLRSEGATGAQGGLMLKLPSASATSSAVLGGGQAQAVFNARDFGAHWPSNTQITVTVLLSSKTLDLTVMAQNNGDVAEPIGIGWRPRFVIAGGSRAQVRLRVPGEMRVDVSNRQTGMPSGSLVKVAGTPYDFSMPGGARLGMMNLDDCFVALHQDLLDSGPVAELSQSGANYGIRMTALTPTIKAMRVVAPKDGDFITIDPQFNYPDPFGREWGKEDTGMVVLQPGQSTQWKIRLELFTPVGEASGL